MIGFVLVFSMLGAALLVAARQRRLLRLTAAARGLLISYSMIALLLLLGELYFRCVFAEPDGLPTLALQNWLARHWHTNTLGYRDRDWTPADWQGRQTVLVVGDSFAAGWGIENPQDRFSDVLAGHLGADYAVINLGKPGTTTVGQTEILREYPLSDPDVVILQYYLNDIEDAALSIGLDPGLNPLGGVPPLAQESYLANFVYWRLAGRLAPQTRGTDTYWEWLYAMYDHAVVWDLHRQQLLAFIDQVESENARLIVVIFPNMLAPFSSIPYVDRVAQVFADRGYADSILKLFDAAEAMPLPDRVVSERDAHASARFNHLVGDLLAERFFGSPPA